MKKIHIIIMLVSTAILGCSCGANDESKIKKAMKEYAEANFSNPKDYKGVVSITAIDTINFVDRTRKTVFDGKPKYDSICKAKLDYIIQVNDRTREIRESVTSWSYGVLIDRAREELANCLVNISITDLLSNDSIYCAKIDSLLKNNTFEEMRRYNVKIKTIQQGELEYVIKDYSAFVFNGSQAMISGASDIDNYNLQGFHMKNEEALTMLMRYTSEALNARTEKLKALKQGEEAAKKATDLCVEYLYEY